MEDLNAWSCPANSTRQHPEKQHARHPPSLPLCPALLNATSLRVKVSASIDEQRDMPSWVKEYAGGLGKGEMNHLLVQFKLCGTPGPTAVRRVRWNPFVPDFRRQCCSPIRGALHEQDRRYTTLQWMVFFRLEHVSREK